MSSSSARNPMDRLFGHRDQIELSLPEQLELLRRRVTLGLESGVGLKGNRYRAREDVIVIHVIVFRFDDSYCVRPKRLQMMLERERERTKTSPRGTILLQATLMMRSDMIKRSKKNDVPPDDSLTGFHLLEQIRVTNDSRCIPYLSTCLVQSSDSTHDGPFLNVGKSGDLSEWL